MRYKLILFVCLGLGMYLLLWSPGQELRLFFCDVGQGDATLIVKGEFQALIDTGPSWEKLSECLTSVIPVWDKKIEMVIITHNQKDHGGALGDLKKSYLVEKEIVDLRENVVFGYTNMYFDIFVYDRYVQHVGDADDSLENEASLVVKLTWGDFEALITGDIGEERELALVQSGVLGKTDILKVAHHGSKFGTTDRFLNAIEPVFAVISVGAKNTYGHPTREALTRLDRVGAKILRTDKMGTLSFKTDGKRIWWK